MIRESASRSIEPMRSAKAMEHKKVRGEFKSGHSVASGKRKDERYPEWTHKQQFKHFLKRGLDIRNHFMDTINLDISPYTYEIKEPNYFFKNIAWSAYISAENFYFFDVSFYDKNHSYEGLIYMPDPLNTEDHIQKPSILELLLPKVIGLKYDLRVDIEVKTDQLEIIPN